MRNWRSRFFSPKYSLPLLSKLTRTALFSIAVGSAPKGLASPTFYCLKAGGMYDEGYVGANSGVVGLRFSFEQRYVPVQHSARREDKMAETRISIVDALRGQQEQLKRLIAQTSWISDAPKATLSEIEAQLSELRRLIEHLETNVQEQLKSR